MAETVKKTLRDSAAIRWTALLLLAAGPEILWIVGGRLGERCRITSETRTVLEASYFTEE